MTLTKEHGAITPIAKEPVIGIMPFCHQGRMTQLGRSQYQLVNQPDCP